MTSVRPFAELAPTLVDVATGRAHADLVVRNGRWVNVYSGEILDGTDIAVIGGRFAYAGHGRYLVPGLVDAHMHVESGMITVTEFCRAVARHGSTSLFIDPHEIANVLGLEGVRLMHDEAMAAPINVFVQMPSCVPSAPGLETAGAELGPDDITEAMTWPNIVGLGEVMNFPGVAGNDPKMVREIAATAKAGKKERTSTMRSHASARACGRCFAWAPPGMMLQAKSRPSRSTVSIPATSSSAPMIAIPARSSMTAI